MSRIVKAENIDNEIERQIVVGVIVSTGFCRKIKDFLNYKYLILSYSRIVIQWCLDYYDKYGRAPDKNIQEIYENNRRKLPRDERKFVSVFLEKISRDYDSGRYENFNTDYYIDNARKYFRRRSLEILSENIDRHLEKDDVDGAQNLIEKHKPETEQLIEVFNPFDDEEIISFDVDDDENRLFRFDGALGRLLGYFKRGWLVTFTGPEKRGKSFWLEEVTVQSLQARLKVLWVSLEMHKYSLKERLYKRITGRGVEDFETLIYPVFDCVKNQTGDCTSKKRKNDLILVEPIPGSKEESKEKIRLPKFNKRLKYRPCTACRGVKGLSRYKPSYWFGCLEAVKKIDTEAVRRKAQAFKSLFGNNLRVIDFPAYSANSDDIRYTLDTLEFVEGFVPDVIVIDYIDILSPEKNSYQYSERGKIDLVWKKFKGMAAERRCLVVTADQAKSKAASKTSIGFMDWSDSKVKRAHIDLNISINQTEKEKEYGVMRIAATGGRHSKIISKREVMVLQQLDIGQIMLDSEFY